MTAAGKELAEQTLIQQGRAATIAQAREMISTMGKAEARKLLTFMGQHAGEAASKYVNKGNLVREAAKGAVRGGISEGLTEMSQEGIQYATAKLGSGQEINPWELEDRLRDALVAGATLGTGFGAAGDTWAYADRDAISRDLERANVEHLNEIDQIRENLRAEGVEIQSVEEILENLHKEVPSWEAPQRELQEKDRAAREKGKRTKPQSRLGSFSKRAERFQRDERGFLNAIQKVESIPDGIAKAITGVGKLINAASTTAFSPNELANQHYGETLRAIRALVGQTRGTINPGRGFEGAIDKNYSTLAQMLYMPEIAANFGTTDQHHNRERISGLLREYGQYHEAISKGEMTADQLPDNLKPHAAALKKTADNLRKASDTLWGLQDAANKRDGGEGVGYTEGWWWKHRDFDPAKVQKNREGWFEFMRTHTNMSETELRDFYDRITGGDATTAEDYFSHVRGIEYTPGQHMRRDAKLSEQEGFDAFGRDDMFATMDSAFNAGARYAVNRQYFGSGGKNLDYLFDKLEEQGMDPKKIDEVAWYTKAIVDSATGNFNRITNYKWAALQKWASTWSVFAGLPLSALSSIPESAMIALGLDRAEVAQAVSNVGQEIASTFGTAIKDTASEMMKNREITEVDSITATGPGKQQQKLNDAGLYWSKGSIAKRVGVGETNISQQWLQDRFFKTIGLTHLTQAQRRASAAMTTDFVANRLAELAEAGDLKNLTNRQQHVYNQLAELGMNVDQMVTLFQEFGTNDTMLDFGGEHRTIPDDVKGIIDQNMQDAVYNFVNLRVQNPGAANRPLFFQDPHYQMLTQFNGFISTFTANVVPKLWNDYIKRGTPQVKYNTFALIMTMMALGAGSQYAKDLIKYGKSSPFLSDPQLLQRAIYSSGVLGQAERVVDIAFPLYGGRPRSSLQWVFDTIVGETGPTVRNVGTLGESIGAAASGEGERAVDKLLAVTPVATFGRLRKGLAGAIVGEDFEKGWTSYDDRG